MQTRLGSISIPLTVNWEKKKMFKQLSIYLHLLQIHYRKNCATCQKPIDGTYHTLKGLHYCPEDYKVRFKNGGSSVHPDIYLTYGSPRLFINFRHTLISTLVIPLPHPLRCLIVPKGVKIQSPELYYVPELPLPNLTKLHLT